MTDVVLLVLGLELLGMVVAAPKLGLSRTAGILAVLPGFYLVLAMRRALDGSGIEGIAVVGMCLLAALFCHVADLARRTPLQPRVAGAHSADG